MNGQPSHLAGRSAAFVALALTFLGLVLFLLLPATRWVPPAYVLPFRVALVAGLGIIAIVWIGWLVRRAATKTMGPERASLAFTVYRLVAAVVLAFLVLAAAGVNGLDLLAGGTFGGLVLGLAAQEVLSNVVAGIALVFARPIEPGERVTITTWQYGLIAPAYPPKFYSQDTVIPGFTGRVRSMGLVYSSIETDEGTLFRIPNSVLIQAAVISHEVPERWVRTKYELRAEVDPAVALARIREAVQAEPCVARAESVTVLLNQATQTSHVISIDAICRGNREEPPRSEILLAAIKAVRTLESPPSRNPATEPVH